MTSTRLATAAAFIALIILGIAWELWLAPLRPGGSMLVLKVVPLLLVLPSIVQGRLRTYQWCSMLILLYVAEGALRATSDRGAGRPLGMIELVIAGIAFGTILLHVRARRKAAA